MMGIVSDGPGARYLVLVEYMWHPHGVMLPGTCCPEPRRRRRLQPRGVFSESLGRYLPQGCHFAFHYAFAVDGWGAGSRLV